MITDDDIKKLLTASAAIFATKQDLKKLKDDLEEKMATKNHFDKIMNSVDKVLGELKTIREEQIFHQSSHDTVDERLTDIEHTPTVAHELKKNNK